MSVLGLVKIVALLTCGLVAGILFGDRMCASFARPALSASSFVQFQQIQHVYFARMMPPLTLTAIVAGLAWLVLLRGQWNSGGFWPVGLATGAMVVGFALTVAVNVPINNQLMTWSVAAPPDNVREVWSRWESIHTVRTILWAGAFALEVIAVTIFPSATANTQLP
jgi:uncharacterized membrane protein